MTKQLEKIQIKQPDWDRFKKAIESGSTEDIRRMLEINPELINMTEHGNTILHLAARLANVKDSVDTLKLILQINLDLIHYLNNQGYTALQLASSQGSVNLVKLLLKLRPELVNEVDSESGCSVLHLAVENGHKSTVELLLQIDSELVNIENQRGSTALHLAAKNGYKEIVELLFQINPESVNIENRHGSTALHLAAKNGHEKIVKFLLQSNTALANIKNQRGSTALHLAAEKGHENIVKLLLQAVLELINITNERGSTVLHLAAKNADEETVKFLLQIEPTLIDVVDEYKYTALHSVLEVGGDLLAKFLLQINPALASTTLNQGDYNALHLAVQNGCESTVDLLLQINPTLVNMVNQHGSTALHSAAEEGFFIEIVEKLLLVMKQETIEADNSTGDNALALAIKRNHWYDLPENNRGKIIDLLQYKIAFDKALDLFIMKVNDSGDSYYLNKVKHFINEFHRSFPQFLPDDLSKVVLEYIASTSPLISQLSSGTENEDTKRQQANREKTKYQNVGLGSEALDSEDYSAELVNPSKRARIDSSSAHSTEASSESERFILTEDNNIMPADNIHQMAETMGDTDYA